MSAETFSQFFMSDMGSIVAFVCALLMGLVLLLFFRKDTKMPLKALTYAAICLALAVILSNIRIYRMPMGGSITAGSMVFVSMVGYWFGLKAGLAAAVSFGFLRLLFDPYIIHPAQMLLDYVLAYACLGLSGLFKEHKHGLLIGYIVGVTGRLLCAVLSGVIFFAIFAPEGMNVWLFSSLYNITYIGPEAAFTLAILAVPAFKAAIDRVGLQARA
ncbi:MAG: energy-coupled thiamine transporter ThiT [Defluviitaleaceae bacterium]|nr:energy-coupled thiamine transporter ThiT [Defluviitaleaceae bacterium]